MSPNFTDVFTYDPSDKTYPFLYKNDTLRKRHKKDRAGYPATGCHAIAAKIQVQGKQYGMHRAVWMYHNGGIPDGMTIDHIDGDKMNNRIENLQILSAKMNKQKGSSNNYKNNTSGVKGVVKCSATGKWKVSFRFDNKLYYFGIFEDIEQAKKVCEMKRAEVRGGLVESIGTAKKK